MKTSLSRIRQVLSQAAFNPKKPGVMQVVAETGNKEYWTLRAVEAIQTAQECQKNKELYAGGLRQAIQLLTLALVELEDGQAKVKDKGRSRKKSEGLGEGLPGPAELVR